MENREKAGLWHYFFIQKLQLQVKYTVNISLNPIFLYICNNNNPTY